MPIANDTEFGLAVGICTTSLKYASHFKRNSEAGMVMVNLPTAGVTCPSAAAKDLGMARANKAPTLVNSIQSSKRPISMQVEHRMRQEPEREGFVTGTATAQAYEPRYIRLDPNDNVAIVVNDLGLPAKSRFPCGLELRNFVPQGHKVALADIPEGAPIRRYNEVIGTAAQRILAGEWVDEARIHMPTPPELDKLELATVVPAPLAPLDGYTFEGFRNPDGSVGTKNVLAISTSVQCVAGTLQFAIKRIKAELLPKYPNVDDVVGLTHNYGCGVAIAAPLAIVPIRTLQNLALNPNFGGEVMVVGLGCEKLVPERLLPSGADGSVVRMQDEAFDGFGAIVEAIMEMADARLACSTSAAAKPAPPPTSSWACNAAAPMHFPV
jgi:galactarate dehydratase